MTNKLEHGTSYGEQTRLGSIAFLSELSVLIDSSYFVGTMNSNVGSFVTLMRSCSAYDEGERLDDPKEMLTSNHYFDSYGTDMDGWTLP